MKRRKGRRQRVRKNRFLPLLLFFVLTLILLLPQPCSTADDEKSSKGPYEWEDWNYYQILGFFLDDATADPPKKLKSRKRRRGERNKLSASDIRKSYRKQAQQWHPDKLAGRKLQKKTRDDEVERSSPGIKPEGNRTIVSGGEAAMRETSIEEATARFQRIAEAYEVLSDSEKRSEYDEYLLDLEDQMEAEARRASRESGQSGSTSGSFFERFVDNFDNFDPKAVFEEFFFGSPPDEEESGRTYSYPYDMFNDFLRESSNDQEHKPYSYGSPPSRVSETTQRRYDPRYRSEVLRVLRREEYDDTDGRAYYRVIGQEFVEEYDHLHGQTLGYAAITEPYLVQEGFVPRGGSRYSRREYEARGHEEQKPHHDRRSPHKIEHNEYLTPSSPVLISANGRFYAGLTLDCELLVMRDAVPEAEETEDVIVWSSETYLPASQSGGCFLVLNGPRLVLMSGTFDRVGVVLWSSPAPAIVPNIDDSAIFYASLDNDGSLSVYRRHDGVDETVGGSRDSWTSHRGPDGEHPSESVGPFVWLSHVIRRFRKATASSFPPRTKAAAALRSLRRWTVRKLTGKPRTASMSSDWTQQGRQWDECIYATGAAGCITPGRHALVLGNKVKHGIVKTLSTVNSKTDEFLDKLQERVEDDEDIFDTILRVAGKGGAEVGKAGFRMARRGLHEVRMAARVARDNLQERLRKLDER